MMFPVVLLLRIIGIAPIKFNAVLRTFETDHYRRWFSVICLLMLTAFSTYFHIILFLTQKLLNFEKPLNYEYIAHFILNIFKTLFFYSLFEIVQSNIILKTINLLLDASRSFLFSWREGSVLFAVMCGALITWKAFLLSEYVALYRNHSSIPNNVTLDFFTKICIMMITDVLTFGAVFVNLNFYLICLLYFKKLHSEFAKIGSNRSEILDIDELRRTHSDLFEIVNHLETISSKIQLTLMVLRYISFNGSLHRILIRLYEYMSTNDTNVTAAAPSVVYLLRETPLLFLQFVFPVLLTNEVSSIM